MMPPVSLAHLCQVVFSLKKDLKQRSKFQKNILVNLLYNLIEQSTMSLVLKFRNHLSGDEHAGVKDIHGILLFHIETPAGKPS